MSYFYSSWTSSGSTSTSYHNGGVEGDSHSEWYDQNLAGKYATTSESVTTVDPDGGTKGSGSGGTKGTPEYEHAECDGKVVLDLHDDGPLRLINQSVADDGTQSGTVEFLDYDALPVGWASYEGVDEIIMPEADPDAPDSGPREDDLEFVSYDEGAEVPEGAPPKVDIDNYIEALSCVEEHEPYAEEPEAEEDMMMAML